MVRCNGAKTAKEKLEMRTDHRESAEVIAQVLRRLGVAKMPELQDAQRRAGLNPSTYALWNLANTGRLQRLGRGNGYGRTRLT